MQKPVLTHASIVRHILVVGEFGEVTMHWSGKGLGWMHTQYEMVCIP